MNEDILKRAIDKIDVQVEATIQVLAGGRQINGNAFDMNNLLITKKNLQSLLAALPKQSKK